VEFGNRRLNLLLPSSTLQQLPLLELYRDVAFYHNNRDFSDMLKTG
jgi:hypothetical protein